MGVSKNSGTPKSSILIGFSNINHPFWGTIVFGNIHKHEIRMEQIRQNASGISSHLFPLRMFGGFSRRQRPLGSLTKTLGIHTFFINDPKSPTSLKGWNLLPASSTKKQEAYKINREIDATHWKKAWMTQLKLNRASAIASNASISSSKSMTYTPPPKFSSDFAPEKLLTFPRFRKPDRLPFPPFFRGELLNVGRVINPK